MKTLVVMKPALYMAEKVPSSKSALAVVIFIFSIFTMMTGIDIPEFVGGDKVLYAAIVNLAIPTGNTEHFVQGRLQGPAYALVICQSNNGYYLFYCDDKWNVFADTWHETIEDAKDQADYEYSGINSNWHSK